MNKKQRATFTFVIVAIYSVEYLFLFLGFLWKYVDSDQLITADMAYFYSKGYIPEPYFWGQSYLFPIESWLAQPLVLIGMRADLATMLVAASLFYTAFFLLARQIQTSNVLIKFVYFCVPLLLPTKFLLVSLMPRNFGSASAIGCIASICYLNSTSRLGRNLSVAALGIACGSYPPILLFGPLIFLKSETKIRLEVSLVFVISFGLVSSLTLFYILNPEAIVYRAPSSSFSISQLGNSLRQLNVIGVPVVLLLISVAIAAITLRNIQLNRQTVSIGGSILAIVVLFLSSERIVSFQDSVFFSAYRFWVAIPAVVLIYVSAIALPDHQNRLNQIVGGMTFSRQLFCALAIGIILLIPQIGWITQNSTNESQKASFTGVAIRSTVKNKCSTLKNQIDRDDEYLITSYGENFFYIYGCYFLDGVFIKATEGDRRWWYKDFVNKQGLTPVP